MQPTIEDIFRNAMPKQCESMEENTRGESERNVKPLRNMSQETAAGGQTEIV